MDGTDPAPEFGRKRRKHCSAVVDKVYGALRASQAGKMATLKHQPKGGQPPAGDKPAAGKRKSSPEWNLLIVKVRKAAGT